MSMLSSSFIAHSDSRCSSLKYSDGVAFTCRGVGWGGGGEVVQCIAQQAGKGTSESGVECLWLRVYR